MDKEKLLEEAKERGFFDARLIKPAHTILNSNCPILVIPKDVNIEVIDEGVRFIKDGNLTFTDTKGTPGWLGTIYCDELWGQVLESYDDLEELDELPSEGVCYEHTRELFDCLMGRSVMKNSIIPYEPNKHGLAWSSTTLWFVSVASSKPCYALEQLLPHIPHIYRKEPIVWEDIVEKAQRVYTKGIRYICLEADINLSPRECVSNGIISHSKGNRTIWIQGQPGFVYREGKWANTLIKLENNQMGQPLTPDKTPLPDRWCIKVTPDNNAALLEFLKERSSEFKGLSSQVDSWKLRNDYYFFYPQYMSGCHSTDGPRTERGYTLIDNITLVHIFSNLKHVLTNNKQSIIINKQIPRKDGRSRNTIEVQGPTLTISRGGSIRAVGLRCSDSEITVRSGHSPNKTGPIKG